MVGKRRKKQTKSEDPTLRELRDIKNLLIVSLIKQGASSEEIDVALRMGAGNIRNQFPMKKFKKGILMIATS